MMKTEEDTTPLPPVVGSSFERVHSTPSIISLLESSDNEVAPTSTTTGIVSVQDGSMQKQWKPCQDFQGRNMNCLHHSTGISSQHNPPDSNTLNQVRRSPNDQQLEMPESTHEDTPKSIDIAIWTQRSIGPQNIHRRSPSTDSAQSGTSIPYYGGGNATSDVVQLPPASETIIVQPGRVKYTPQEVSLWEGSPELHIFPASLHQQLGLACTKQQTDMPDCVKAKWPAPKTVYDTGNDRAARFIDPTTKEDLLMARYHYGKGGQIIVVKQKVGTNINGGKAAIVNYTQDAAHYSLQGSQQVINTWKVWDPLDELSNPQYILRIMETTKSEGKNKLISGFKSFQQMPLKSNASRRSMPSASSIALSNERAHGTETSAVAERAHKRPRHSYDNAYDSAGNLWPRRGLDGYIVVKRASDGQTVKLACPQCSRHDFETVTGIGSHCRSQHGMLVGNNHEVADVCGIPPFKVLNDIPETHETRQSARIVNASGVGQVSARQYATPAPSSTPAAHVQGPVFVFKRSDIDVKPRIRPLKACNSAEKLFVNALVAGVARKDTLMLTVQVDNGEPINIMRGDVEDFHTVLQAIEDAGSGDGLTITVTVEEFDL